MDWVNAPKRSKNNKTADSFLAQTSSRIILMIRICPPADQPCLKQFWFRRWAVSIEGWIRFRSIRLYLGCNWSQSDPTVISHFRNWFVWRLLNLFPLHRNVWNFPAFLGLQWNESCCNSCFRWLILFSSSSASNLFLTSMLYWSRTLLVVNAFHRYGGCELTFFSET